MIAPSTTMLLPELRQELQLLEGPSGEAGPAWLLYDPVRHNYFQIDATAYQLLLQWRPMTLERAVEHFTLHLDRAISEQEVFQLVSFLQSHDLVLDPKGGDARAFGRREAAAGRHILSLALHRYLFFRVPLLHPERFLRETLPLVQVLYTRAAGLLCLGLTLIGLYLSSRQWEQFATTFLDFLSLEGVLVYGAALLIAKTVHELAHAYTATRLGVRVTSMGVAFMIMTPMLYTDVTDAWRLKRHRDKVAIDAAGMIAELALAGIATFLWSILYDGPFRSAAFAMATTGWIMSLAVNLNPLMRFDGYHILSDLWRMPNLQARANAHAIWSLRECLFDLRRDPPETFDATTRRLLIGYAIAAWIYRQALFIGIALVVYHTFFKALGVLLFAIEIGFFIVSPIVRETAEWWKMRNHLWTSRSFISLALLIMLIAGLFLPLDGTVSIQGVMKARLETAIHVSRPARLEAVLVTDGASISEGETLVALSAPDLEHEISQTRLRSELVKLRLDRIAGDTVDRADALVLASELIRHRTQLEGLEAERRRLTLTAPHQGVARDVDRDLSAGVWINETGRLARVIGDGPAVVSGYVAEEDVGRILLSGLATFVPEDPTRALQTGRVVEVSAAGSRSLDLVYVASVYGGAVPTDRTPDGEIRPRSARHLVHVVIDAPSDSMAIRGTLHLPATPESLAAAVLRRIFQILIRESAA
jgi:putative peptide zinc metalloprotease protein